MIAEAVEGGAANSHKRKDSARNQAIEWVPFHTSLTSLLLSIGGAVGYHPTRYDKDN
jgi:hypothetical protein